MGQAAGRPEEIPKKIRLRLAFEEGEKVGREKSVFFFFPLEN